MHYVDEGRGQVVLCLHGGPTWSYLYRKVIPNRSWKYRIVAPDFIGFGRSDKPDHPGAYSLRAHVDWLGAFVRSLNLCDVTVVCHGWSALVALSLAAEEPDIFFRLVLVNAFLPAGEPIPAALGVWGETLLALDAVSEHVAQTCPEIEAEEAAAYGAPFPEARFQAGLRSLPALLPAAPGAPGASLLLRAREMLRVWYRPALVLCSDGDPVAAGWDRVFRELLPSCREPVVFRGAGHLLPEQRGEEVADRIQSFILRTLPPRPATTFQPVPFW